jgi:DNA replication and repair protein RecF
MASSTRASSARCPATTPSASSCRCAFDAHRRGTALLLKALKLNCVRNLEPVTLEPGPRFNVFYGDNGQGKTNLLEAIYVTGALRSFRTQRLADLIAFGREEAYLAARVAREGMERVYELTLKPRSRKVRLDGKTVRPISKYFGDFNVVLFAPEDLLVPRGSPSDRRRFLDRCVFNRNADYLGQVQAYDKVIKNRNALLRQIGDPPPPPGWQTLLDVFDQQVAELGARVVTARRAFVKEVLPRFRAAFEAITKSGIEVEVAYVVPEELRGESPDEVAIGLAELLESARRRDMARMTTSVGPHRDDLSFLFGGHAASAFASQGQLRALVLAWKTAEMDLLADSHGEAPILLLDDVSSELDSTRNEFLFDFLRSRDNQCFISTTHPKHVLLDADRRDFEVSSGRVTVQD